MFFVAIGLYYPLWNPPGLLGSLINDSGVREWIEGGGILIYLSSHSYSTIDPGIMQSKGNLNLHPIGKGVIISADAKHFTNKALIKDRDIPYELVLEIDRYNYNGIFFNESHFYSSSASRNLWSIIPLGVKMILYQLLLVIAAYFYYKGKPFGKAIPLYEEVVREENEYLYSVATLYQEAKCWDIIVENYFKNLLIEMGSSDEEFLDYWQGQPLKNYNKAKKIYNFINNWKSSEKIKEKEYINIINSIEELRLAIRKGRDIFWMELK